MCADSDTKQKVFLCRTVEYRSSYGDCFFAAFMLSRAYVLKCLKQKHEWSVRKRLKGKQPVSGIDIPAIMRASKHVYPNGVLLFHKSANTFIHFPCNAALTIKPSEACVSMLESVRNMPVIMYDAEAMRYISMLIFSHKQNRWLGMMQSAAFEIDDFMVTAAESISSYNALKAWCGLDSSQ